MSSGTRQIGVMGFVIKHKEWKEAQILFGDDAEEAEERAANYMYNLDIEHWEESEGAQGDPAPTQVEWVKMYHSGNLENWELYEPAYVASTERPILEKAQATLVYDALLTVKGGKAKTKAVNDLLAYLEPFVKGHQVGEGSNGNGSNR